MKLTKNARCPECKAPLEIDMGHSGSYFDPPEPPQVCCTECDYSPDVYELDWEDWDKPVLTDKQEARIERIRNRLDRYISLLYLPCNRRQITVAELFDYCPDGDFSWDGEPEDVGNAWHDVESGWHQSCQCTEMGRKDGKTWFIVSLDNNVGDCDYQPVGGWDEREGDSITDSVLSDLWFDLDGRSIDHFYQWALYHLDVAITGEDPLEVWIDARRSTTQSNIKAAMENLRYLHRMVKRIKQSSPTT